MGQSKDPATAEEPGSGQLGLAALIGMPWLMYSIMAVLFVFAYHHYAMLVWGIISLWMLLALLFLILDARTRMAGSWFMLLGILCICAVINGCITGSYNYWSNMYPYWSYYEHRTYTNVLPTEPAVVHSDAGKIVFANTARVDTTRALGYKVGTTYCVAPILDDARAGRVEYWAAGINCCNSRGDFSCDDAWDANAKSGLVLPSMIGGGVSLSSFDIGATSKFWHSSRDHFIQAVKMAEASYELTSSEHPLLVRWVSNPQAYTEDLWRQGVGYMVASITVYFLISLIFGAGFQACSKRASGAGAPRGPPAFDA